MLVLEDMRSEIWANLHLQKTCGTRRNAWSVEPQCFKFQDSHDLFCASKGSALFE